MYIDSHAHLTSEQIFPIVDQVLERAKLQGLDVIVNICTDIDSLKKGIDLRARYPFVYNTASTTPHDVVQEGELFFPVVEKAAREGHLVAIGETGLDYFYEHSDKKTQQKYLSKYFALAKEVKLPVIFHCREAFEDLFDMANDEYAGLPAVLHCFTGTLEEAKQVLDRGWYLSISGIVTFKKSLQLQEVAKFVPLDRLFIETDSPYLAPQSKRGMQNEPSFICETAMMISSIKNIPVEEVAKATSANARAFFSF
ncbi:MAG: TatD family hydrolase [Chlamydiae bacterium]|nr:TatD family hydrolase [Chlamydiota bacterium]